MLCPRCRALLAAPPHRVATNVDTHVPVFALGPYAEAHRGVILAAKEKNNFAVRRHVGAVLDAALKYLDAAGNVASPFTLVPAPTRARNARLRGGDPVAGYCRATSFPVAEILRLGPRARDQTELGVAGRRQNLAGRVHLSARPPRGDMVLVDDVVTTGATLAASVERLLAAGARVQAAVVVAAA